MTSICSEANFRFNFCVSNFSALLPSWVHFLGLTFWKFSKMSYLLILPFPASQDSYKLISLHMHFFFCHFNEIWEWREARLICFTCHLKRQVNTFKFYFQEKLSIYILDFFYSNFHSSLPTSTSRRFERSYHVPISIKQFNFDNLNTNVFLVLSPI